jgi:hypothetical protein
MVAVESALVLAPVAWLADLYFLLLEILFYFAPASEAVLAIAVAVLGVALFARLGRTLLHRVPGVTGRVLFEGIWGFLAVMVLVVQAYLVVFALRTQPVQLVVLLAVAGVVGWRLRPLLADLAPADPPGLERARTWTVLLLVGGYLLLGLVMAHLATRNVHGLAALMAGLSLTHAWTYRLLVLAWLLVPVLPFAWRLADAAKRVRLVAVAPAVALALLWLPTPWFVRVASVLVALFVATLLLRDGFSLLCLPHPAPRQLAGRLLVLSMMALNAVTVHYGVAVWRCPEELPVGVRRLSTEPGAFDVTVLGDRVLASLREPQQLLALDAASGAELARLDTAGLIEGTGSALSWIEPETLLALDEDRALVLLAVSDDEEANRVAVVDGELAVQRLLDELPRTSIADIVRDGQGRVYASTEFDDRVIALDGRSLAVTGEIEWPGAETNKILLAPAVDRMFSLGLWSDPLLRALELSTGEEVATLDVGTRSWDMAYDADSGRLFVPRLLTGEVLVIDALDLEVVDRWHAGFGARPVDLDPFDRRLYVGNMYDGDVRVFDLDTGELLDRIHLGGYLKGLHVDPRTHEAYTGCACGVFGLRPPR